MIYRATVSRYSRLSICPRCARLWALGSGLSVTDLWDLSLPAWLRMRQGKGRAVGNGSWGQLGMGGSWNIFHFRPSGRRNGPGERRNKIVATFLIVFCFYLVLSFLYFFAFFLALAQLPLLLTAAAAAVVFIILFPVIKSQSRELHNDIVAAAMAGV